MDVTPLIPEGRQIVQRYSAAGFRISGIDYAGAVIVTPTGTQNWTAPATFDDLTAADFGGLSPEDAEILLLGCGAKGRFIGPALRAALKEKGFSIDAMDTGAACRTYNVLMAEGRRVAAALLPLSVN